MLIRILFAMVWFVPVTGLTFMTFCVAAVMASHGTMSDTEAQHLGSLIVHPVLMTATMITIIAARRGWLPGTRRADT